MAWSPIVGHDAWIAGFREVARSGRLAHAYLFVGPAGIGKRTFAIELAKAYLCENPPPEPLTACDRCPSCILVEARNHPDFFLVAKPEDKNELPIETMRKLCGDFCLKTARGRGKVAVLEGADDLNEESANCFLKTLEEPPPRSMFILIGTDVERQMPTIRSRCHVVRFAPLPAEAVHSLLEKSELPDRSMIPRLVRLAEGSPGQALALADPDLWKFRNRLLSVLSKPPFDTTALGKEFVAFAEEAGKETAPQRIRVALVLRLLIAGLRDALRIRLGEPAPEGEDAQTLQALSRILGPDEIVTVFERVLQSEIQLDRYIQVSLVAEGLVDALSGALCANA
jgi:DNA polymerase III subunit delta'